MEHILRELVKHLSIMWDKHERCTHKKIVRSWTHLLMAASIFAGALWFGHKDLGVGVLGIRICEAIGDVLFDRGLDLET